MMWQREVEEKVDQRKRVEVIRGDVRECGFGNGDGYVIEVAAPSCVE